MLPVEEFPKWLKLFMDIVQRPIPVECEAIPEDERSESIWWKCKKWTLRIIQRVFERFVLYSLVFIPQKSITFRYGNKGNVDKPYTQFAEEYSKTYVLSVIESLVF
jgi:hypothetical protein